PTDLRIADFSEMSGLCTSPLPDPVGSPGPEQTPVLAEARGDYEVLVLVAERSTYCVCFSLPGGDAIPVATYLPTGTTFEDPVSREAHLINAATWQPLPDQGEMTYAFGSAGEEVTGISLSTENGSFAEASNSDGWWVVWFPGEVSFAGTMTVTT